MLPVQFHADTEGQYECHVLLRSGYDIRNIYIEATVTAEEKLTEIEFHTQAILPLTQNIPVVSEYFLHSHLNTLFWLYEIAP